MLKNVLRVASLVSAVVIGGVLVVRASGCTNDKPAPVTATPPAPPAPPATPGAVDAGAAPPDAGASMGFNIPDEKFIPATKAAAPIFEPSPQPQAQQAPQPK